MTPPASARPVTADAQSAEGVSDGDPQGCPRPHSLMPPPDICFVRSADGAVKATRALLPASLRTDHPPAEHAYGVGKMTPTDTTGSEDSGQRRVLGGEEWGVIILILAIAPYQLLIRDNAEKAWLVYFAACAASAVLLVAAFFMKWKPGRFTAVMLTAIVIGAAMALMAPEAFPFM